jgi:hypothetical protein
MDLIFVAAIGFIFGGFFGSAVAIVAYLVLVFIIGLLGSY